MVEPTGAEEENKKSNPRRESQCQVRTNVSEHGIQKGPQKQITWSYTIPVFTGQSTCM